MPAESSSDPPIGRVQAPFVGRNTELAHLHRLFEEVHAGRTCLVLVEGPPGIGKTAMVDRFLDVAGDRCVLRASGEEAETSLSFGVLTELVSHAPAPLPDSLVAASKRDRTGIDPLDVGAALIDLLEELQHAGPVVLVCDDAHWWDRPSLQALTFALRHLRADRMLALVITRDVTDSGLPDGIRRVLTDNHTVRLSLHGLDADELRTLSAQLGVGPLSAPAAARLRAHTDGNPLYAQALLEQLPAAAFHNLSVPLPAPRSFALLVLAKLAACDVNAQELVAAASVLGMRCALHLAADLAQLKEPLPALEGAITAGLLVEEPGTGLIRFSHPLVRAAVIHQLGPVRRASLHIRAAGVAEDEPTRLRHRAAAASGPDGALAADLARFGRREAIAGAWIAAADHLSTAARLTPGRAGREQLILEAVECRLLGGEVADRADLTGRLRTSSPSAWRSYVLARLELTAGRFTETDALLHDAWQRCDTDVEPALAARIAGQMATVSILQARGHQAVNWADLAQRLAPQQIATDLLRFVRLVGLGMSGHGDAALALLGSLPDPTVASVADLDKLLGRGLLRIWTDDLAGARHDLVGLLAVSHGRSVGFQLLAADLLAMAEYRLGEWDDASAHNELALSIATDADQAWLAPLCHATTTLILAAQGKWEQATAHADTARLVAMASGNLLSRGYAAVAAAQLARARAQPDGVIAALDPLMQLERCVGIDEPGVICWHDLLVDALVADGDLHRAEAVLISFEARAAEVQRHSAMAAAARARGGLAAARGDTASAVAAYQTGLDHSAQVNMPFERAILKLGYGEFLRRAGKRAAAGALLEAAHGVFERLGARAYLDRCEREMAACGGAIVGRRIPDRGGLTPQEFAVAHLVAQGLTNNRVARDMALSVKTVEYHLGHVYAKLRVRSRDQLADRLTKI